jgi:hypothetical protein
VSSAELMHSSPTREEQNPYLLAASSQVWNGMVVLLGAARDGPRRNMRPTLRGASTFNARGSRSFRNDMMLLYHPTPEIRTQPVERG